MSFAEIWTHWRVLRGMQARETIRDVQTMTMGSRGKPEAVKRYINELGGGNGAG
ncbi:hypothetical protein NZL82_01590 [Sphingomonas sanguinis]|uniref:hypothetical protein n=1 Tax=Sphingomonas sp. LC-1 TaxID=3110957 RepID=UPI0021BA80E1|nr:hypothetical protein [Sphingomonas sp. LC-1]MCT8000564.1 hypothetical protein [Sphingomonas sp. LC-1]